MDGFERFADLDVDNLDDRFRALRFEEQRTYPRDAIDVAASIRVRGEVFTGRTVDVSLHGVGLDLGASTLRLEEGERIAVRVQAGDVCSKWHEAMVCWSAGSRSGCRMLG